MKITPPTRLRTVSETQFTQLMRNAMNESAQDLPEATGERLRSARRSALNVRKASTDELGVFGKIGSTLTAYSARLAILAPSLALGVALIVISQNNADNYVQSVAEIDSQVLSQEVPLDALYDKGFARFVQAGE